MHLKGPTIPEMFSKGFEIRTFGDVVQVRRRNPGESGKCFLGSKNGTSLSPCFKWVAAYYDCDSGNSPELRR